MGRATTDPETVVVERVPTESDSLLPLTTNSQQVDELQTDHSSTLWKIYAIVLFVNIGLQILSPAQIKIYESVFCDQWYHDHPHDDYVLHLGKIPENLCKIKEVQQEVSTLKGWLEFFGAMPGLLLSVPMGMLVDSVGRKYLGLVVVLTIWLVQCWAAFISWFNGAIPLQVIWGGSVLYLFGGGAVVAEMVLACILTDISSKEGLTVTLFRTTAFNAFGKVIGPLVAGLLMRFNPWWAIYTGLAILSLPVILIATVPETLRSATLSQTTTGAAEASSSSARLPIPAWKDTRESLREVARIWSDWRLWFVALTYPFRMVCYALSELIQRYVSDRYGWTLADATLLYSIQAVGSGIMLSTFLPWISDQIDVRYSWSVIHKNVMLSRASLLVLALSYAIIGLAPTAPILVIGMLMETMSTGFPAAMRALASALIEGDDKGRVFSILAIVETLSTMMAYPLSATLFNLGLQKGGGAWLGLPYDAIAVAGLLSCLLMSALRFESRVRL